MSHIDVGTRVRYRATFLRATGCYTGQMPRAMGTVVCLVPLGETLLAEITWDDPDTLPGRVNVTNLWPAGTPEPA
jgi:hypothetical protein